MPLEAAQAIILGAAQSTTDTTEIRANQDLKSAVFAVMEALDAGRICVVTHQSGTWVTEAWIKQAILFAFSFYENQLIADTKESSFGSRYYDKIPLKFSHWSTEQFREARLRCVPGAVVRYSAYVGSDSVLMPCFINVGARIGKHTMVDTWATIGSCAYVGDFCHISGGAGIGGVLEPLQARPVIIENHCFIGARCEVAEGVIIGHHAVLAMGVKLGASTKIIDRATNQISYGYIPPHSVVVPGSYRSTATVHIDCAVIVKKKDQHTTAKTLLNSQLRE